ncbi:alpha/beta fold hydrolase [Desulfosediminicola sp.]|uniref:alpha/beta fold hydrolase n=1 Tax=Desulfosediminicola sp. TaxID=2886825 RepID=UPI003AF20A79
MKLYSRIIGQGEPVIILHGLFGMSDNWLSIAKGLANSGYCVHVPDLRNHGRSPHKASHRYTDMCEDILEYIAQHNLERFSLIGHSMGGKLAMIFGLLNPELLEKLIIVDIAPSRYDLNTSGFHDNLISTLLGIDLHLHTSRATVRQQLCETLGDEFLAQFLVKNLTRQGNSDKRLAWKPNLPVLQSALNHLMTGLEDLELYAPCTVPTLFVKGGESNYYLPEHEQDRIHFFPNSSLVEVEKAGHWLHSEQPDIFMKYVTSFLASSTLLPNTNASP